MRADLRERLRPEKSFVRKSGHKAPRALILIVCEDAKSSPAYFKDIRKRLRLTTTEVEVCGEECGSAPISVVEFAIQRAKANKKEGRAPEHVFCVVDVDGHTTLKQGRQRSEDFNRAARLAGQSHIEYIVSSPCFERWYLVHFEPGDRPYDRCDPLIKHLKKHLRSYDKGTFSDFDKLWALVDQAVLHAERLRATRQEDQDRRAYTDVDLVVGALRRTAT